MPTPSAASPRLRPNSHSRVLTAARRRFLAAGVRKTTMSDVAREGGVSRQFVYKAFLGRRELVEAAVVERIGELADDLTPIDWSSGPQAEEFLSVSVAVIRGIRSDPELQVLLGDGSPVSLHEVLWTDAVRRRGVAFWLPWLQAARTAGLLRLDIADDDMADWLQTVYASIILRSSLDPESERAMIERFVLTSLSMASSGEMGGVRNE
ncbi:TetR/AcrR family transcriptional regulator [Pseudonocardia sp. P1]